MKTRFIIATRENQNSFFSKTATGRSISPLLNLQKIEVQLFPENTQGLPAVYNSAIRNAIGNPANLVFMHDDVHILDYFIAQRIEEGLTVFDVIGVAGNQRRVDRQPAWAFVDEQLSWDSSDYLSGTVAHGKTFPPRQVAHYGPSRQKVKLLDGVLLAIRFEVLAKHQYLFDEQFDFHFYDMDFCRQAEIYNLNCGTWDIAIMHESGGAFGNDEWQLNYQRYIEKWKT